MKGILTGFAAFLFLMAVSVVAVRRYSGKKYFRPLVGVFLLAVVFYAVLFLLLPRDPGFLPSSWRVGNPAVDFANGLLLLSLLFHSYWDTVYTSFFTGFSTKILMQLAKAGNAGLSLEALMRLYSEMPGKNPVLSVRLQNLVQGRYLAPLGQGRFRLLPKGHFFAVVSRFFQRIFHMGEGG